MSEAIPMASVAKAALRKHLKAAVAALSRREKADQGKNLCQILLNHPVWTSSLSVLGFVPLEDEPAIMPVLEQALNAGKTLFLPAFEEKKGLYTARKVTNLNRELVRGRFGILEPGPLCPPDTLMQLDLSLVPGVGFDLNGCRLGRGNGYYDRLLSEATGQKCGLAFECQLTNDIAKEPHDIVMNWVVLPSRWLAVK